MTRNGDKPHKLAALEAKPPPTWQERYPRAAVLLALLFRPFVMQWALNVVCALLIAFILTHPTESGMGEWDNVDIAPRDFKVPRDLEILDQEGTEKKQAEAALTTRSVYDFDPLAFEDIRKKTTSFFTGMRELYPAPPAAGTTAEAEEDPIVVPATFVPEKEEELVRGLGIELDPGDLEALKAAKFSPEAEQALIGMVRTVYFKDDGSVRYIVPAKELVLKEKDKGIVAYSLDAKPEEAPAVITNFDAVFDLAEGRETVEKAAKSAGLDKKLGSALSRVARDLIEPNLTFNKNKTEEAKTREIESVRPLYYKFKKDEVLVRKGDRLQAEVKKKIAIVMTAISNDVPAEMKSYGLALLIVFFTAFVITFAQRNVKKFVIETKDLVFASIVLVLSLGFLRGLAFLGASASASISGLPEGVNFYYLMPLACAAMLVRMVLNSERALVFTVVIAALGGLAADDSLLFAMYTMAGGAAAAGAVGQCRQRSTIVRAGLILGIVNVLMIIFISISTGQFLVMESPFLHPAMLVNILFGFASAFIGSIIVTGLVPIAEAVFSYATDIKLLELLNQDHPLLKDLSMKTPGTHQHCLMVANLAEAAAKAVGANPLLARVSAMYHDIGKMEKPLYYGENQWEDDNVHDRLTPSMSTLIIHNHVKEGVELAKKYKLPNVVIESIRQHHGTTLLKYFYEKAKELNETGSPMRETDFRYPGPRPQTRESAIVHLADVVEATAKSQRDMDQHQLTGMIQNMINRSFVDGQLDECDLTLKNLHEIARSFNQTLSAIYRPRPDYPQAVVKGAAAKKKKAEHHATPDHDKPSDPGHDHDPADAEQTDNTLKRLGMDPFRSFPPDHQ